MIKFLSTPIYQLYLLQLENYELGRFWNLLRQRGYLYSGQTLRKKLAWKAKPVFIFIFSVILCFGALFLSGIALPIQIFVALVFLLFLQPIFFSLIIILLNPVEMIIKKIIIKKAVNKIANANKLKIIGIAGSYGKTTMKNILATVLSANFSVLSTPDSVNTPLGIANWILKKFNQDTQVLILEMGEHYKGDIKELCGYFKIDVGIITGINESHIERLQNIGTAIETIFELAESSKDGAPIFLNADDKNVVSNYAKFTGDKEIIFYNSSDDKELKLLASQFNAQALAWQFELEHFGLFSSPILGNYAVGNIVASIKIGRLLGMIDRDIKKGIAMIVPVEHRLEPIVNPNGILVIDDSYNGNPEGVRAAIKLLEMFKDKRKIFLTPGLVETGKSAEKIHIEIGKQLKNMDLVILIENSVTHYIEKGLLESDFEKENIIFFENAEVAHNSLQNILLPNDVIVFQNDWGDQYV